MGAQVYEMPGKLGFDDNECKPTTSINVNKITFKKSLCNMTDAAKGPSKDRNTVTNTGEIQAGNTGMARSQMRFPNLGRGSPLSGRQGTSQGPIPLCHESLWQGNIRV